MTKILLAGDHFISPQLLAKALAETGVVAEVTEIANEWPLAPMRSIGSVHEAVGDEHELIAALQGCRIAFSHCYPFSKTVLDACPELKLLTICRGGPVNVDRAAATRNGVLVTCAPGRNATATAEHTVGMILAAVRQIAQRDAELHAGQWRGDYYQYDQVGPEITNSTVGLVGYGAIGSRVANILKAFNAHIIVYDPFTTKAKVNAKLELVSSLAELMRRCSIVSIHARATADNVGMIGAKEIAMMPSGGILVNCARGSLVDYEALCDALDTGHLYAAACDVFDHEPLGSDDRVLNTPRLTVTPHLAGASKQAAILATKIGAADLAAFLAGKLPKHVVNPEVLS